MDAEEKQMGSVQIHQSRVFVIITIIIVIYCVQWDVQIDPENIMALV